jgi:DNA-directed RNA polymerase subunit K/omega
MSKKSVKKDSVKKKSIKKKSVKKDSVKKDSVKKDSVKKKSVKKSKEIELDDFNKVDNEFSDEELNEDGNNFNDEEYFNTFEESDDCLVNSMVEEDNDFFQNETDTNFDDNIEIKVLNKEDRITKNLLTNYELVRILGERQKQLTLGAKPLVKNYGDLSYEEISILELKNKMLPYKIRRKINNNYEIWDVDELKFHHLLSRLE